MKLLTCCVIVEAGGYYGRAWGHNNPKLLKAYVLYLLLTLSAPPFFAATIYIALSRIITSLRATDHSILSVRWLTTVFVMVDIVCFSGFIGGAGMQVAASAKINSIGTKILLCGLIFQIVCSAFFIFIAIVFHRRNTRAPGQLSKQPFIKWRRHLWTLYTANLMVLVRNVFRVAEYAQGFDGLIAHNEAFIYVFDAGPMWFVMVAYALVHPGQLRKRVIAVDKKENICEGEELLDTRAG